MTQEESLEWLKGKRSMTNIVPQHPIETWQVRIAEADAAMTQQAYWIAKAHAEGIVELFVVVDGKPMSIEVFSKLRQEGKHRGLSILTSVQNPTK